MMSIRGKCHALGWAYYESSKRLPYIDTSCSENCHDQSGGIPGSFRIEQRLEAPTLASQRFHLGLWLALSAALRANPYPWLFINAWLTFAFREEFEKDAVKPTCQVE